MSLSDLIRKRSTDHLATAIPAIPATQPHGEAATVARIATVAVANPKEERTAPPATVARIATVAVANPVRCIDCAHSSRADQHDELGAWRLCSAGKGGRFAFQEHWCTAWEAIESESQPAPPPPPPKLAARQTPEQRQQCFDARVAEFLRAGMTLDDATAATAKEGW